VSQVDHRAVGVETALVSLADDGVVDERVEIALLGRCRLVAVEENVSDHGHLGGVATVVAATDGAGRVGRAVLMTMQEDVSFDPSIRAVQVEHVVAGPDEDVVDELNNRRRSVASREIYDVVVAVGRSEKVPQANAASTALDAAS